MNIRFDDDELKTILTALCLAGAYCDIGGLNDVEFKELYTKIIMLCDKPSQLKIVNKVIENVKNMR